MEKVAAGGVLWALARVDPSLVSPLDSPSGTGSASASVGPGQWHLPLSSVASRASGWARPCDWPIHRDERRLWAVEIAGISLAVRPATQASQGTRRYMFFEKVQREGRGRGLSTSVRKGTSQDRETVSGQTPESHVHPAGPVLALYLWRRTRSWSWGREKACSFLVVSWDSGSYLGLLLLTVDGLVWSGLVTSGKVGSSLPPLSPCDVTI